MQVRLLFCTILAILTGHILSAQQVIINSNSERVVIYPDGSWRLYQESDSVLLKNQLSKNQVYSSKPTQAPYENEADNPGDILSTVELSRRFADLTLKQSREASRELANLIDKSFELEGRLKQAEDNMNLIEPDQLANIEEEYALVKNDLKDARKHQKKTTKFAEKAQELLNTNPEKRADDLNKLMVKHSAYYASRGESSLPSQSTVMEPETTEDPVLAGVPVSPTIAGPISDPYTDYRRKPAACLSVVKELDEKGRPERIVIARNALFAHTDEDLRQYFRDKDHITCTGQLAQVADLVYLYLEFSIASPNAQKNFGTLPESSLLRLTLIDGTEIDLNNLQGDAGRIDPYSGNTLFVGRYLLENSQQRKLAKTEIDQMRIVWSTGYEDYDIFAVDFFIDQFSCLQTFQ